jgi:hypothetical protein
MSTKLTLSAAACALAMAALALGAPSVQHGASNGAGSSPIEAGLPAPSFALPFQLPR